MAPAAAHRRRHWHPVDGYSGLGAVTAEKEQNDDVLIANQSILVLVKGEK